MSGHHQNNASSTTYSFAVDRGTHEPCPPSSSSSTKRSRGLIPKGGAIASGLSLTAATMGAGTLSLPYAMYCAGAGVGILFLIGCCAATIYSVRLLMIIVDVTGYRTYEKMSRRFVGKWFEGLTAFLIFVFCWGIASSYVTAVGDLLTAFDDAEWYPDIFRDLWGRRLISVLFWGAAMLPLSLLKHINSLRYASFVGMVGTAVLVCSIVYHAVTNREAISKGLLPESVVRGGGGGAQHRDFHSGTEGSGDDGAIPHVLLRRGFAAMTRVLTPASYTSTSAFASSRSFAASDDSRTEVHPITLLPPPEASIRAPLAMANFDLRAITALPIIIFGYCCHANCFEIYSELRNRSVSRMTNITSGSMIMCTLIYIVCGVAGATDFGEHVAGNILSNFHSPTNQPYILLAYVLISFTITTAFPLCIFPMRDAVLQLLGYSSHDTNNDETNNGTHHPKIKMSKEAPFHVRVPLSGLLAVLCVVCGLFAPEISVFFGLLGGICGATLSFIWPALFMLKLHGNPRHVLAMRCDTDTQPSSVLHCRQNANSRTRRAAGGPSAYDDNDEDDDRIALKSMPADGQQRRRERKSRGKKYNALREGEVADEEEGEESDDDGLTTRELGDAIDYDFTVYENRNAAHTSQSDGTTCTDGTAACVERVADAGAEEITDVTAVPPPIAAPHPPNPSSPSPLLTVVDFDYNNQQFVVSPNPPPMGASSSVVASGGGGSVVAIDGYVSTDSSSIVSVTSSSSSCEVEGPTNSSAAGNNDDGGVGDSRGSVRRQHSVHVVVAKRVKKATMEETQEGPVAHAGSQLSVAEICDQNTAVNTVVPTAAVVLRHHHLRGLPTARPYFMGKWDTIGVYLLLVAGVLSGALGTAVSVYVAFFQQQEEQK